LDPNSSAIIAFIGSGAPRHADFGSGEYRGQAIGIPYQIVAGDQPKVNVSVAHMRTRAIPDRCRYPPAASLRAIPTPATAIGTYWCLIRTLAGYMSCTTHI
jgi:hypothetical protein